MFSKRVVLASVLGALAVGSGVGAVWMVVEGSRPLGHLASEAESEVARGLVVVDGGLLYAEHRKTGERDHQGFVTIEYVEPDRFRFMEPGRKPRTILDFPEDGITIVPQQNLVDGHRIAAPGGIVDVRTAQVHPLSGLLPMAFDGGIVAARSSTGWLHAPWDDASDATPLPSPVLEIWDGRFIVWEDGVRLVGADGRGGPRADASTIDGPWVVAGSLLLHAYSFHGMAHVESWRLPSLEKEWSHSKTLPPAAEVRGLSADATRWVVSYSPLPQQAGLGTRSGFMWGTLDGALGGSHDVPTESANHVAIDSAVALDGRIWFTHDFRIRSAHPGHSLVPWFAPAAAAVALAAATYVVVSRKALAGTGRRCTDCDAPLGTIHGFCLRCGASGGPP